MFNNFARRLRERDWLEFLCEENQWINAIESKKALVHCDFLFKLFKLFPF